MLYKFLLVLMGSDKVCETQRDLGTGSFWCSAAVLTGWQGWGCPRASAELNVPLLSDRNAAKLFCTKSSAFCFSPQEDWKGSVHRHDFILDQMLLLLKPAGSCHVVFLKTAFSHCCGALSPTYSPAHNHGETWDLF